MHETYSATSARCESIAPLGADSVPLVYAIWAMSSPSMSGVSTAPSPSTSPSTRSVAGLPASSAAASSVPIRSASASPTEAPEWPST